MTDTERGPTTPYLTDFGWVFVRQADISKLTESAKRRISKRVHDYWCAGHHVHGWTVTFDG